MASMTETPQAVSSVPSHEYHAEAHVLSGYLQRPIEQKIERLAPVELKDRRGGHLVRVEKGVSIEGLISFTKGETRVSGSRSLKDDGWITLSTSILEGYNAFEIITADRVVSQASTNHPYENGHIPHVTFLGTQFNNLRVSGIPVALELNFGICGAKPSGDASYLDDVGFLNNVKKQTESIANASGLPKELKQQYDERLAGIKQLIGTSGKARTGDLPKVTCSLVQSIGKIPIPGVQSFGHVLVIPDFGVVSLGEIEVGEQLYTGSARPCNYFELALIKADMGCIGHGKHHGPMCVVNGTTKP